MALDSFSMTVEGHHSSLSPEEIERELRTMWKPMEESDDDGSPSASRVVIGNVVWIGLDSQMDRVRKVIQKVVPKYPCRLFLLEYMADSDSDEIDAAISAQCFVPSKGAAPVCCEVIQLKFGPKATRHIRGAVAPLLLPDLQTVLWVNLGDVFLKELIDLKEYVDLTIGQISLAEDPAEVLTRIVQSPYPTFDLSWYRTQPIRHQMAAFFDNPATEFSLEDIESVRIGTVKRESNIELPEVVAALFVGWIGSRLGWKKEEPKDGKYYYRSPRGRVGVEIYKSCSEKGSVLNNINSIEITDRHGEVFHMEMEQCGGLMNIWIGDREKPGDARSPFLSELSETDALGAALNTPTSHRSFCASARLAVPVLSFFQELGCAK